MKEWIKTFLWAFIPSMILIATAPLYEPQISEFYDNLWGYKPDATITVFTVHNLELPSLLNLSTNHDWDAYKIDAISGINFSIVFNNTDEGIKTYFLMDDEKQETGLQMPISGLNKIDENLNVEKRACLVAFINKGTLKSGCHTLYVGDVTSLFNESSIEGSSKRIVSVSNFGNKEIKNFKATICINGFINNFYGDLTKDSDHCINLRSDNILPQDSLSGIFTTIADPSITQIKAWDSEKREYPENSFIQGELFFIKNCTTS